MKRRLIFQAGKKDSSGRLLCRLMENGSKETFSFAFAISRMNALD